ncbi:MAG: hypothetical protein ACTIK3_07485, partial [Sphingobacteriaceae bacterium]
FSKEAIYLFDKFFCCCHNNHKTFGEKILFVIFTKILGYLEVNFGLSEPEFWNICKRCSFKTR